MQKPVETLEGWYSMHIFWKIDWANWRLISDEKRRQYFNEFQAYLNQAQKLEDADKGSQYIFNVNGHKADLGMMILRETLDDLNDVENKLAKMPLFDYLKKVKSYISVTEVGTYTGKPKTERGWAYVNKHLYPILPKKPYFCFYPMSKLRLPDANWYTLPYEKRQEYMHEHGKLGRTFAGKIWQFITGSMGLDDYEWGVSLFADDPLQFKKIISDMRYYEASSVYGEFPYFIVGTYLDAAKLEQLFLTNIEDI